MSYNISSIEIIQAVGFEIADITLKTLAARLASEEWVAETWDPESLRHCLRRGRFPWCGTGSGIGHDLLRDVVLPAFDGAADLVLTWESGDSRSGLRLLDHRVTEHEVVITLK